MTDHAGRSELADGYYWVKVPPLAPQIGLLDHGQWWITGSIQPTQAAEVEILSRRLILPAQDKPND